MVNLKVKQNPFYHGNKTKLRSRRFIEKPFSAATQTHTQICRTHNESRFYVTKYCIFVGVGGLNPTTPSPLATPQH